MGKRCKIYILSTLIVCMLLQHSNGNALVVQANENQEEITQSEETYGCGNIDLPDQEPFPSIQLDEEEMLYASDLSSLPAKYNTVEVLGTKMPGLREQIGGTCWAHASIALAEISMAKQNKAVAPDYDELALAYFSYHPTVDPLGGTEGDKNEINSGNSNNFISNGGNVILAVNILSNWIGAAPEDQVPNISGTGTLSNEYAYEKDVACMTDYRMVNLLEDPQYAKKCIQEYGAISMSYYSEKVLNSFSHEYNSYNKIEYGPGEAGTNHAVTIVGWDDDFPKDHFVHPAKENGAWLVRNSWYAGEPGDLVFSANGYFWMSYESVSISENSYAMVFHEADNYNHQYQYDGSMLLSGIGIGQNIMYGANIFQAKANDTGEILKAVSFKTNTANNDYEVKIYKNLSRDQLSNPESGTLVEEAVTVGSTTFAGYYTVPLHANVTLEKGEYFAVVIKLQNEKVTPGFYAEMSYYPEKNKGFFQTTAYSKQNQSFIRGENYAWSDYGKSGTGNICIKAFTVDSDLTTPVQVTDIVFEKDDLLTNGLILGANCKEKVKAQVLPETATNKALMWYSDNLDVASVDRYGNVTAIGNGSAHITVESKSNPAVKKNFTVTVDSRMLVAIEITGNSSLQIGDTTTFQVQTNPADYERKSAVQWSSDNTDILTIDSSGNATATGNGVSFVTATLDGVSKTLCVTVVPLATSLQVSFDDTYQATLTWDAVADVDYYEIYYFYDKNTAMKLRRKVSPTPVNGSCTFVDDTYKGQTSFGGSDDKYLYAGYKIRAVKVSRGNQLMSAFSNTVGYPNYRVTYALDGGVNSSKNPTLVYPWETYWIVEPSKTGYEFLGWYLDESLTTKLTDRYSSYSMYFHENTTLYAKWEQKNYSIYLLQPGATEYNRAGIILDCKYQASITLPDVTRDDAYQKPGYRLTGWNTKQDGTGNAYENGGSFCQNLTNESGACIFLYPQYEVITYQIQYHLNGGTNAVANPSSFSGDVLSITLEAPTKEGWYFEGWYLDEAMTIPRKALIENQEYQDFVLYAQWTRYANFHCNIASEVEYGDDVIAQMLLESEEEVQIEIADETILKKKRDITSGQCLKAIGVGTTHVKVTIGEEVFIRQVTVLPRDIAWNVEIQGTGAVVLQWYGEQEADTYEIYGVNRTRDGDYLSRYQKLATIREVGQDRYAYEDTKMKRVPGEDLYYYIVAITNKNGETYRSKGEQRIGPTIQYRDSFETCSIKYVTKHGKVSILLPTSYEFGVDYVFSPGMESCGKANGWEFVGWYLDSALTQPAENTVFHMTEDIVIYAKWKAVRMGSCGDGLTYSNNPYGTQEQEETLTITGGGEMENYYRETGNEIDLAPWYGRNIKKVVFPTTLKTIGSNAFWKMKKIESIDLRYTGVERIGEGAFSNCTGLTEVHLPNTITVIEPDAFAGCSRITSLTYAGKWYTESGQVFDLKTNYQHITEPIYKKKMISNAQIDKILQDAGTKYVFLDEQSSETLQDVQAPEGFHWKNGSEVLQAKEELQYMDVIYDAEPELDGLQIPVGVAKIEDFKIEAPDRIVQNDTANISVAYEIKGYPLPSYMIPNIEIIWKTSDSSVLALKNNLGKESVLMAGSISQNTTASITATISLHGTEKEHLTVKKEIMVTVGAYVDGMKLTLVGVNGTEIALPDSSLSIDASNLTAANKTYLLTAKPQIKGVDTSVQIKWESTDKSVVEIKQKDTSGSSATVTIKGIGKAVLRGTVADEGNYCKELVITIADYTPVLDTNRISVNAALTSGVELPLFAQNGNAITSVSIADTSHFTTELVTSHGVQKVKLYAKNVTKSQTIKTDLTVQTQKEIKKVFKLQITVNYQEPKISLQLIKKANSFYKGSNPENWAKYKITSTAKITNVTCVEQSGSNPYFQAIYENGELTCKAVNLTKENKKKLVKKVNLLVTVEGYQNPVKYTYHVSVENKKPSLKINEVKLIKQENETPSTRKVAATVMNTKTKMPMDLTGVSLQLQKAYTEIADVQALGSQILVDYVGNKTCSYRIEFFHEDWTDSILASGRVSIVKNLELALTQKKVVLNQNMPSDPYGFQAVGVSVKDLEGLQLQQVKVEGNTKSQTLLDAGAIQFQYDNGTQTLQIGLSRNQTESIKGTYQFKLLPVFDTEASLETTVANYKPVTLTVVIYDKVPTVKVTSKGSISFVDRGNTSIVYTPKLGNCTGIVKLVELTGADKEYFTASVIDGKIHVQAIKGKEMKSKVKYTLGMEMTLENGYKISLTKAAAVKMDAKLPKTTASVTKTTFYRTAEGETRISIQSANQAAVMEKISQGANKNSRYFQVTRNLTEQAVVLRFSEDGQKIKKGTYTIPIEIQYEDAATDVSPAVVRCKVVVK